MIEIDVESALRHPGSSQEYVWQGDPGFEQIALREPLRLECVYSASPDGIRIRGTVEARLALQCSRCLAPVTWDAGRSFDELFLDSPDDGDSYAYDRETKRVSLDQMIYDLLLVDIPLQVLCSETCRGLCPHCGHDLNTGPCECTSEDDHAISPNNPFAKLKDLF